MKRLAEGGIDDLQKQYFSYSPHFPELVFDPGQDSFTSRFAIHQATTKRRVRYQTIPSLVLDEKVPERLYINESTLEDLHNDYVPVIGSYCDMLSVLPELESRQLARAAYVHHIITHILKTQALISTGDSQSEKPRDQGFTQAKALILLPYKSFALEIVDLLIKLHCKGRQKRVSKRSRKKFESEYTDSDDLKFGDDFKLGLTLAPRHHMFLYTPFKHSDLILASPLALSALLTEDPVNVSCVSSIEILVIDEAGIMLMQNWEHVDRVVSQVNLMPNREFLTGDIARVREYWLDQCGKDHLQTVVISDILTPHLNALITKSKNSLGCIRVPPRCAGVLSLGKIHRFRKFSASPETLNDQRFQYFTQNFWPKLRDQLPQGTVLFCASYYEFVRLKNWLEEEEPGIMCVSEYTPKAERQRCVSYVETGKSKGILLTERLVYFRHVHVRKAAAGVFYSLPLHPSVYQELIAHVTGEEIWCVCSNFDALALQRLVGDEKAKLLLESTSTSFTISQS